MIEKESAHEKVAWPRVVDIFTKSGNFFFTKSRAF